MNLLTLGIGAGILTIAHSIASRRAYDADFKYAVLTNRRGDGDLFLPWLLLYRAGLVDDALVFGDSAHNDRLIAQGYARLGVRSPGMFRLAICQRPIVRDAPVSEDLAVYASRLLRSWDDRCRKPAGVIVPNAMQINRGSFNAAWCERMLATVLTQRPDRIFVAPQDQSDPETVTMARALADACAASFGPGIGDPRVPTAGIPRLLHHLWIGPKRPPLEAMETWRKHNPGLAHTMWNEERLAAALPASVVAHAMTCREINGRADVLRYHLLEKFGGVFIDADAICEKPLPDSLFKFDAWTCFEDESVRPGLLACGYMASSKGNALMRELAIRCDAMDLAEFSARHGAWEFVGNQLLTNVVSTMPPRSIAVLPSRCFIGKHYSGAMSPGAWPQYARQLWGSTKGYDQAGLNGA